MCRKEGTAGKGGGGQAGHTDETKGQRALHGEGTAGAGCGRGRRKSNWQWQLEQKMQRMGGPLLSGRSVGPNWGPWGLWNKMDLAGRHQVPPRWYCGEGS